MKTNKLIGLSSAFITSLTALFFVAAPHAFAATRTWTGSGSDNNFTTAANWGGTAPVDGDDLIFPANVTKLTANNDNTVGTSFNSITFNGTATQASNYTISGNAFLVVAGITNSMTGSFLKSQTISANTILGGSQSFTAASSASLTFTAALNLSTFNLNFVADAFSQITGVISGSGTLTKSGSSSLGLSGDNGSYPGAIVVSTGGLDIYNANSLGSPVAGTTVASGANLFVDYASTDVSLAEPLTLSGDGTNPAIYFASNADSITNITYTFSGAVTLNTDVIFNGNYANLKLTGTITDNGHKFTVVDGTTGNLILPSGTIKPALKTTTYSADSSSTFIGVTGNQLAVVDGNYGTVDVDNGTLEGTGTVNKLVVSRSGIVAPGHSPGKLTVVTTLEMDDTAVLNEELQTKDTYDQIKVGDASITTGHAVVLGTPDNPSTPTTVTGNPVLNVSIYQTGTINKTDTFTIIDNLSTTDVLGTFKDLPEGATFALNGGVMKITYKGGDGNDVVLSVVTVPTVANTGFMLTMSNPFVIAAATAMLAGGAYVLSRRYAHAKVSK